ncbi:MAG: helix-hairpin-helix domain-containing protein [Oceanospirillales bacterium]|uniref:Competence protein ComEA n=1 Tax=Marinobacterium halophilum TaxID=267374 RepID=A0A2P8F120_9GAMM|nr:ComEA family DNA-binding protein [Marinobacterium halophilum]MBR9827604.1 helix-hairpin-helix domain-containing protein [Oceanospirillales bacterium]PSL15420.1 competence protein ComEA [Marinobacterium halophilum]
MIKRLLSSVLLSTTLLFSPFSLAAEPVDINTASAAQIAMSLNGIGPAKAEAIVAYREANGPFVAVEQITDVKGIGATTLDKNRELILLQPTAAE